MSAARSQQSASSQLSPPASDASRSLSDGRHTGSRPDSSTLLSLDKVSSLAAGFEGKILCFPSCPFFHSLVPVTFSLFFQSRSYCFLLVSSLSRSISSSVLSWAPQILGDPSCLRRPGSFLWIRRLGGASSSFFRLMCLSFSSFLSLSLLCLGCRLQLPLLLPELMICLVVVPIIPIALFWWARLELHNSIIF
jgi:hypothetical protein